MAAPEKLDPSIVTAPKIDEPWTVEKALATIPTGRPTEGSLSPVPFFHFLEGLKITKRKGWIRYGINHGESVADHSWRMSIMVLSALPALASRLDLYKCMKMSAVHDMAESLVGDLIPADNVPKPEKLRRESLAMHYLTQRLLKNVPGGVKNFGDDLQDLWEEYEASKTLESRYVHDIDKVELLLQMVEYEKRGEPKVNLEEFTYVTSKVLLPEMKVWAEEILNERKDFWAGDHSAAEVGSKARSDMKAMQDNYYDG